MPKSGVVSLYINIGIAVLLKKIKKNLAKHLQIKKKSLPLQPHLRIKRM